MDEVYYGVRVSAHCRPKIHREHNNRTMSVVGAEEHIDHSRLHENILDMGDMYECYEKIFGQAVTDYNKAQKRKDRRIENYLDTILNDKRSGKHKNIKVNGKRKAAYEFIFKLGNRDNQCDEEKAIRVLKLFTEKVLPKKYPNIAPIGIYLHNDEFSIDSATKKRIYSPPHIHFDFIPVAHRLTDEEILKEKEYRAELKKSLLQDCQMTGLDFDEEEWKKKDWQEELVKRYGKSLMTGMGIQSSLTGCLVEMGFKTAKRKGTAQMQFEEAVRHDLQDFAEGMGIIIDRTPGQKHPHYEKDEYIVKRENERREEKLQRVEELLQKENETLMKQHILNAEEKKELISKEQELQLKGESISAIKKDVEKRELNLKKNTELYTFLHDISLAVKDYNKSFFSIEKQFEEETTIPIQTRIGKLISGAKKLISGLAYELTQYKKAFSNFWKHGPKDFRSLAQELEENECTNYKEYYASKCRGDLISQKEAKKDHPYRGMEY
jgi:hypothetical protein